MKAPLFTGTCTALITPFANDTICFPMLDRLIDRQLAAGIRAIVFCGTTGEAAALSPEEKLLLLQHAVSYINHRCKVIAGTGSNCTKEAIRLSQMAEACDVDGLLVVTPYYNKTTQSGLISHYKAIADSVHLPIILYNVPSRTGMHISLDAYEALCQHPNIHGVKEASCDLPQVSRIRNRCGDHLHIWSGSDETTVAMMALGAKGVISTTSNLTPRAFVQMCDACTLGDYERAGKMQNDLMPLIDAMFCEVNPIPIKAALRLQGLDPGPCRPPLCSLSEVHLHMLENLLSEFPISLK